MLTIYYTWLNIGVLFSRHTSLRTLYPSTIRQSSDLPCPKVHALYLIWLLAVVSLPGTFGNLHIGEDGCE